MTPSQNIMLSQLFRELFTIAHGRGMMRAPCGPTPEHKRDILTG